MGGPVVRRLAARTDTEVVVLTRDRDSERARAVLETDGRVRLVEGDAGDPAALETVMAGVDEVFANTDFFSSASPVTEYHQGLMLLETARTAGVDRFVWSSLDNAATLTDGRIPVPHYDAKAAVEGFIGLRRSEEMMQGEEQGWYSHHVAVLVTAPYFENLQGAMGPQPGTLPDGREGVTFTIPLGQGRWPLIGVEDIAWFAGHLLQEWETWGGRTLRVVGDSLTGSEIADTFERVTGIPAAYEQMPLQTMRELIPGVGHDFAAMFEFFQDVDLLAHTRDLPALREIHPELMTFEAWLHETGWTAGL